MTVFFFFLHHYSIFLFSVWIDNCSSTNQANVLRMAYLEILNHYNYYDDIRTISVVVINHISEDLSLTYKCSQISYDIWF